MASMKAVERLHHRESLMKDIAAEARKTAREHGISVFYLDDPRGDAGVIELRSDGQKLRHDLSPVDGADDRHRRRA